MPYDSNRLAVIDAIAPNRVLEVVATTSAKITPRELEKTVSRKYGFDRKRIRLLIRELVSSGELVYTYEHGCSFLEVSFNRPVRISERVVLKPPEHDYRPQAHDVVVMLHPGDSFGSGRHPTTRLAVRGIDYALGPSSARRRKFSGSVLDIGTGSGVLAITAVRLGIAKGMGLDIDPCALAEAKANVAINCLSAQIEISDQMVENIEGPFSLVVANLRYPGLQRLVTVLPKICGSHGVLVLSGIHSHECPDLLEIYGCAGFDKLWVEEELDWAGMVLVKT